MDPRPAQQPFRIVVDSNNASEKRVRWWHVLAVLVCVFTLYTMWSWFSRKLHASRLRTVCEAHPEKIAILLHCHRDAQRCANSALSFLRAATCPDRIEINIYQELDRGDTDVFEMCMTVANSATEKHWVQNMRITTTDDASSTTLGSIFAWKELLRNSPKTKWVLLTQPGTVAVDGWDVALSNAWMNVSGKESFRNIPLLTAQPPRQSRTSSVVKKHSSDGMLGMARDWVNIATASGQHNLKASSISRSIFTVVGDLRGRIPTIGYRTFPRVPKHAVQVLGASASMIFGPGEALANALRTFPEVASRPIADYALDWVLSSILYESGSRFFTPPECPLLRPRHSRNLRPPGWNSKDVSDSLSASCAKYARWAGVGSGVVSGRARMGLLPALDGEDILQKFGSHATFDRIKRGFARNPGTAP